MLMSNYHVILGMGFPQSLENMENENGLGKAMKNWQKVVEFCDQTRPSNNFTNFAPKLYQIHAFFVDIK